MDIQEQQDYNIFTALIETIHKKELGRLQFAKCYKCGRFTPFRLTSVSSANVACKTCGNILDLK